MVKNNYTVVLQYIRKQYFYIFVEIGLGHGSITFIFQYDN